MISQGGKWGIFVTSKTGNHRKISHAEPDSRDFEICAEDGTVIGVAYVAGISSHNRHCTIGLTIGDRDYWGKGYGSATQSGCS
ncbi:MAG: GNAT family N-acetyltransferase [Rhodothermales bacterium]